MVLLYVFLQHPPSHMELYFVFELVAPFCSMTVIFVEGAVFGLVHIRTLGDGVRSSKIMLICNGIKNLRPSDCKGCVVFEFPVNRLP